MATALRPVLAACPGCDRDVLRILDVDTDEPLVLDTEPVDQGRVAVYSVRGAAVARRFGVPARVQPAWREHDCPAGVVHRPVAAQPADPYEDEPAAVQQHGGWRAS